MNRKLMLIAGLAAISLAACATEPENAPTFDPALAAELGADEYGMRAYVFVLLRTGPASIDDPERRKELFAGHFTNMQRLADRGELVLAGPLGDDGGKRGLFVLNAPDIEAAKTMVGDDPAVAAGVFIAEYSTFYGSAALMQVNAIHKKVQSKQIE